MKKFDLYITYVCGSACNFCCVRDKVDWFRQTHTSPHMALDAIKEIVDEKAAAGFSYVTLTGGEPTLHPKFPEIVRYCKKLNMRVSVNSNATILSNESFCRDVAPFIDEIVVSIHGHTRQLHDRLTGTSGSYDKFIKAMVNLHRVPGETYLITDTVILTENIAFMAQITDFLTEFPKLNHILFSNVNIPPDKVELLRHLVPTLPQVQDILPTIATRVTARKGRILRFYGIPLCIMGEYKAHSSDLSFEPKTVIEQYMKNGRMHRKESPAPRPNKAKRKTAKCLGCFYENLCGGVFNSYFTLFGDAHLQPVKKPG
jgi:MoaA/NifB/PqqE/SkfB family radical SAM enzyme